MRLPFHIHRDLHRRHHRLFGLDGDHVPPPLEVGKGWSGLLDDALTQLGGIDVGPVRVVGVRHEGGQLVIEIDGPSEQEAAVCKRSATASALVCERCGATSNAALCDRCRVIGSLCGELKAALIRLRSTCSRPGLPARLAVSLRLDEAAAACRGLHNLVDDVGQAYLNLVEAGLDVCRDAAAAGHLKTIVTLADATHNIPNLFTDPGRWSHRFFRECFLSAEAEALVPWAAVPLRDLVDALAPSALSTAEKVATQVRVGDSWAQVLAVLDDLAWELDIDEEEVALRVLHILGGPRANDSEEAMAVVAIAMGGDDALFRQVTGSYPWCA